MCESDLEKSNIHKKMSKWLEEVNLLKGNITSANETQTIKKFIKMDFLTTFIIICDISYEYIRPYDSNNSKKMIIKNIVGSVFGRLIFETEPIQKLNKIVYGFQNSNEFCKWINDRRNGYIWIKDTEIESLIDTTEFNDLKDRILFTDNSNPKGGLTRYEIAIYEFALITGSSYTDIESMIARGVSRAALCNILYSFMMIRELIDGFKSHDRDLYLAWWYDDSDLFRGQSGINYYFDGMMILDRNKDNKDRSVSNPWLLKCATTSQNPLDAISSVCSILEDIEMYKCVLFLPTYPSVEAMRYSVHAFAEKDIEIIMLYLHDLYELLTTDPATIIANLDNRRIRI